MKKKPVRRPTAKEREVQGMSLKDETQRLTALETTVGGLVSEVHQIAAAVQSMRDEFSKSRTEDAARSQWTLQGALGIVGALAVWSGLLAAGLWWVVQQGNEPDHVKMQMLQDRIDAQSERYRDHVNNHGHPAVIADMAALFEQVKMGEVQHIAHSERLKRLEEWYNGHGQKVMADIVATREKIAALGLEVERNTENLQSRNGERFNMSEYRDFVSPRLVEIEDNARESAKTIAQLESVAAALGENLRRHEAQGDHPFGVVEKLASVRAELTAAVAQIAEHGKQLQIGERFTRADWDALSKQLYERLSAAELRIQQLEKGGA